MSLQNKIGLLIDEEGITNSSSPVSIGLIKWEDIKDIRATNVMSTKFLIIDLINQEYYIERIKSKLKLKLVNYNVKMYGTPVTITSTTLNCNFENLMSYITKSFEQYKDDQNNLKNRK